MVAVEGLRGLALGLQIHVSISSSQEFKMVRKTGSISTKVRHRLMCRISWDFLDCCFQGIPRDIRIAKREINITTGFVAIPPVTCDCVCRSDIFPSPKAPTACWKLTEDLQSCGRC